MHKNRGHGLRRRPKISKEQRKEIEQTRLLQLEKDNFDDEDHLSRKARTGLDYNEDKLSGQASGEGTRRSGRKRKLVFDDFKGGKRNKRRKRKVLLRRRFNEVFKQGDKSKGLNKDEEVDFYFAATAGPSQFPRRYFCELCGSMATYSCYNCGQRFCCVKCFNFHNEKRCFKFR